MKVEIESKHLDHYIALFYAAQKLVENKDESKRGTLMVQLENRVEACEMDRLEREREDATV